MFIIKTNSKKIKKITFIFFLFSIISSYSQGSKVTLKEVQVSEKALPEINILGENYSYRHRDVLIKKLLRLPFWSEDFVLKIDLSYFNEEVKNDFLLIEGETIVKIDGEVLTSKHKYKSMKRIKELLPKIKEVSIDKNDQIQIIIKTHL
tara:strand:- start:3370 stop:3816 length:447 start_codon:yes stop_codon:yes gene_type:complete